MAWTSNLPTGFEPFVSVTMSPNTTGDYVCDGTNDEVQFDAALAELSDLGGGVLYIKKGATAYSIDANLPVSIDFGNLRMTGDYPEITLANDLLRGDPDAYRSGNIGEWGMFYVDSSQSGVDNIEIDHIHFNVDGANQGTSYGGSNNPDQRGSAVSITPGWTFTAGSTWSGYRWASNIKIHDNIVEDPFITAFAAAKCKNVWVYNNKITGIYSTGTSRKHICAIGCDDVHINFNDSHLSADDSTWYAPSNNIFFFVVGNYASGWNGSCTNLEALGNHCWGSTDSPIEANGGTGAMNDSYNIKLNNNMVYGRAIIVSRISSDFQICNNTVNYPGGEDNGGACISASGLSTDSSDIFEDGLVEGNVVTVLNRGASTGVKSGIKVASSGQVARNVTVRNNVLNYIGYYAGGTGWGIEIDGGDVADPNHMTGIVIEGNTIRDPSTRGINVTGLVSTSNVTIRGNTFIDCPTAVNLPSTYGRIIVKDNYYDGCTTCLTDAGLAAEIHEVTLPLSSYDGTIGTHPSGQLTDGSDITVRTMWTVPAMFHELQSADVLIVPTSGGVMRYNASTNWGAIGTIGVDDENYNASTDSVASTDSATLTANDIEPIDISAAFTGIARKDRIGIAFQREGSHANDTVNALVHALGIRVRWV